MFVWSTDASRRGEMLMLLVATFFILKFFAYRQRACEFLELEKRLSMAEQVLSDLDSRREAKLRTVCKCTTDLLRRQLGMIKRLTTAHSVLCEWVKLLSHDS